MLQPREADVPALFLVLVVLPLVAYILLGKCNEASKRKAKINVLAQLAFEETLGVEAMTTTDYVPIDPSPSSTVHFRCARCFAPATTRCSQCKSIRYCSGKCQIIHWRLSHKHECKQLNGSSTNTCSKKYSSNGEQKAPFHGFSTNIEADVVQPSNEEPKSFDRRTPEKYHREISSNDVNGISLDQTVCTIPSALPAKESPKKRKSAKDKCGNLPSDLSNMNSSIPYTYGNGHTQQKSSLNRSPEILSSTKSETTDFSREEDLHKQSTTLCSFNEKNTLKGIKKVKKHTITLAPIISTEEKSSGETTMEVEITKMTCPKKLTKIQSARLQKAQILFPYEEFVKFFQYDIWDLSPIGLLNCGNSCYANAVLQCLSCTKPLINYFLRRSHSKTCCAKDWCLMCELEQHVSMLREGDGPLSPIRILSRMRNIGSRLGGGNQEDAHEFLRVLVMSMQSICLEGLGGEKKVDSMLQETTFIQQTFGGRLRSKVECLRCHHESERYENIMDVTLEILGWVECLEDAFTQFTSPEDLDGDNMYKCGRCSTYVKARKQLSIHEAPNILTIVLKRFQTGKYGKINKCVTFPDMLDMIPFMTNNGDRPPLYMLYAVVVHLDTSNELSSGHYVSYVKDPQGKWFRIDDTEVIPVALSQVMSEGAYMLFYSRSFPRPPRAYIETKPPLDIPKRQSPPQRGTRKERSLDCHVEKNDMNHFGQRQLNIGIDNQNSEPIKRNTRIPLKKETYLESLNLDFSDATSSDWSLFTSSDESSFTTESTRDSFSTVDYGDPANKDPITSLFNTFYVPECSYDRLPCTKVSDCRPQTRYISEQKGCVLDSFSNVYNNESGKDRVCKVWDRT